METKAHHILVGAFVLIASAMLIGVILWLGKGSVDRDMHFYEVVFDDEVSGLTPGSPVEYSGITVGDVQNLRLDENDPRVVRVRIRVAADTPVRADTGARLGLANITGSALIRLYGGTPDSPRVTGTSEEPEIIIADRSGINRLLANSESLLNDVNSLMQNVNALFNDQNTQRVSSTLDNIEQITTMLARQQDDFDQIVIEFRNSMTAFTYLADQSATLIAEQGSATLGQLREAMQAIEATSSQVASLIANNEEALGRGLQGLQSIGPATNELRQTMQGLQRLIQELETSPRSFFLNQERVEEVEP